MGGRRAQAPLQPLQDNLESQTYETFERDSTKYDTYQAAVAAALRDRVPDADAASSETVLMVSTCSSLVLTGRCSHTPSGGPRAAWDVELTSSWHEAQARRSVAQSLACGAYLAHSCHLCRNRPTSMVTLHCHVGDQHSVRTPQRM